MLVWAIGEYRDLRLAVCMYAAIRIRLSVRHLGICVYEAFLNMRIYIFIYVYMCAFCISINLVSCLFGACANTSTWIRVYTRHMCIRWKRNIEQPVQKTIIPQSKTKPNLWIQQFQTSLSRFHAASARDQGISNSKICWFEKTVCWNFTILEFWGPVFGPSQREQFIGRFSCVFSNAFVGRQREHFIGRCFRCVFECVFCWLLNDTLCVTRKRLFFARRVHPPPPPGALHSLISLHSKLHRYP